MWVIPKVLKKTLILIRLWLAQGKFQNFFLRKDACEGFKFLKDFEFRLHEGAGQAAAGSAAAMVMPGDEVGRHAAAAIEDLGGLCIGWRCD